MPNDSIIAEPLPQIYEIPPPNGDGRGPTVEQIRECPFCSMLLNLPDLLHRAVLDLAGALAASL